MSFIGYRKRLEELAWGFEPIRNGEIFSMNKYFNFFCKNLANDWANTNTVVDTIGF